jgi:hypothetical protein
MPITFNPFGPVYHNLFVPLATSLAQPYVTLLDTSLRPLYQSVTKPCKNHDQALERSVALIKTAELIVQFSIYFFLYQKGWHFGMHYLGIVGAAGVFSLIYGAGCWVDTQLKTNMNSICTATWLYYKGLRTVASNREGLLASIIIGGYLNQQHEKSSETTGWAAKREKAAEWIAPFFFQKPEPLPQNAEIPATSSSQGVVDSSKDSTDGKSE